MVADERFGNFIQFDSRNAWSHMTGYLSYRLSNKQRTFTYFFNFCIGLDLGHYSSLFRTDLVCAQACSTSLDTARFGQTFIMAHQQVAFYLLQRIENNTYQNQQGCTSIELCKL